MQNELLNNESLCLLVEDQKETRDFFRESLQNAFPGIKVIAVDSLSAAKEWLNQRSNQASKLKLSLALIDLGLPDGSGIEIIQLLKKQEPETLSVVITIYDDDSSLFSALSAGASGYLLKEHEPKLLIDILRRIEKSEPPLSPSIARRLITHFQSPGLLTKDTELTPREKETLTYLARGLTVAEAATAMHLSALTVAGYVKIIYQKLHISNRAEATREAIRRGLI